MSYKLEKPFTRKQRAEFVSLHQGMIFKENENAIYFLEPFEKLQGDNVVEDFEEYEKEQNEISKQQMKASLICQLEELDKKRIRAVCEPEMKTDSQSWLEYYNEKIKEIRMVMAEL